ncbi:MAG: aminoacyl-histidine dipeptidase [Sediminicola sp.]
MEIDIRTLEPKQVWNNFADLNAIPRPSKKEERVVQFMLEFGNGLGLQSLRDMVGNVIIRKPATPGMEDRKMVTLQSHLDMVHQKNSDTVFDFENEGIQMFVDGDWVRAKGTTLGADNGMGVAAIMSLLESSDIPHPALEALFTVDEETGMTGAMGLEPGFLQGDILLNLDTEEDDEIDIGCAGGVDITGTRQYTEKQIGRGVKGFEIVVRGLRGGHSGMDIHKGFGNANKIMNRLLHMGSDNFNIRIASIEGGGLRNAIPRESVAKIVVDKAHIEPLQQLFETWTTTIKNELGAVEPQLEILVQRTKIPKKVMGIGAQEKLLKSIHALPNGVYAMSGTISDLVETSNNLARVQVKNGTAEISCLARSSVDSAKMDVANSIKSALELAGFEVSLSGSYPGWKPDPDSEILTVLESKYTGLFGSAPKVVACHAGLECGILGRNYPEMDMISFGPTIKGAHSPEERVSISSVRKFWKFLLEVLQDIPAKDQ